MDKKAVSPVIAIVLLLMMTVAAAGAAYFWLTQMQSGIQEQSTKSIENIMQQSGRRLIAQAAICEPTAPEGMVAWYEFEETDGKNGSAVLDSSENNNKGTLYLNSTTQNAAADGKVGKALEFDGTDDYVEVPDGPSLDVTESISISAWAYYASTAGDHSHYIVNKMSSAAGFKFGYGFNNDFVFFIGNGTDSTRATYWIDSWNQWNHVVSVFHSDTQVIEIYVNGEGPKDSEDISWGLATNAKNLFIGSGTATSNFFNGTIDEIRIYDRALSQSEINETYKGKMKVKVTVRNIGSVKIPEAEFVANLEKDGTTVDSDTYTTTSSIETDDLKTLTFYFNEMRPGGEYTVSIPGIDVSQAVSCQSLE